MKSVCTPVKQKSDIINRHRFMEEHSYLYIYKNIKESFFQGLKIISLNINKDVSVFLFSNL